MYDVACLSIYRQLFQPFLRFDGYQVKGSYIYVKYPFQPFLRFDVYEAYGHTYGYQSLCVSTLLEIRPECRTTMTLEGM